MPKLPRWLLRAAHRLSARRLPRSPTVSWEFFQTDVELLATLSRRARRAYERGWQGAVRRLREQLQQQLRQVERSLSDSSEADPRPLDHGELLAELIGLTREFDGVEYLPQDDVLCAVTPPVELERVELGRFRIEIELGRLPQSHCLRVVALDPNPAASDSRVTHPHVRDHRLCVGDGEAPMRQALVQRRLYDACLLIRQILQAYGPDSAYVALDQWHGGHCEDCGAGLPEDESIDCNGCESRVCFDCSGHCERCHSGFCGGCLCDCPSCGRSACDNCRASCAACQREVCRHCLHDQDCELCHEDFLQEEPSSAPPDAAPEDPAPVVAV